MTPFDLNFWEKSRGTNNQNSEVKTRILNNLQSRADKKKW